MVMIFQKDFESILRLIFNWKPYICTTSLHYKFTSKTKILFVTHLEFW